jgi:hypothetical protein
LLRFVFLHRHVQLSFRVILSLPCVHDANGRALREICQQLGRLRTNIVVFSPLLDRAACDYSEASAALPRKNRCRSSKISQA